TGRDERSACTSGSQAQLEPLPLSLVREVPLLARLALLACRLVRFLVAERDLPLEPVDRCLSRRSSGPRAEWLIHRSALLSCPLKDRPRENARAKHSAVELHDPVYARPQTALALDD